MSSRNKVKRPSKSKKLVVKKSGSGKSLPAAPRDLSSEETLAIHTTDERDLGLVRYQLRAATHRIVSDCERLLGHMERAERRSWRDLIGKALIAARQSMALVERRLGHVESVVFGQLDRVGEELREPQQQIVEAMTSLLAMIPAGVEEELLLQDARGIRETAARLAAIHQKPEPAANGSPRPGTSPGAGTPGVHRKASLLVVDDDPAGRRALSRLLGALGYEVAVAENGKAALSMAEEQAYDLILTDITMPEMDGFELLRRIKSNDATRHVPVIMVSGLDDLNSVVRCIEQGAEDHITKPYETVLLQARVRASLERKRMRDVELAYLRRVSHLTTSAEAVERGSYVPGSLVSQMTEDDELSRLARVFDRMVTGLRSREEQLQQRLRELRREVRQSSKPRVSSAVSEESHFNIGEVLAERYEILGELGKGGMGMVYLARDRQLAEDVAMKVVRTELIGQDPTILERLKSEIRLARRISHRNVVRTHDWGEWHGTYFLTMEFVKGISLAEVLETRGRLSVESTLAIGMQLAEALAVAHDQQIIHRDIKPANLLLDEEGGLKVMDFGLARLTERTADLTQAGFVVGTPRYMAPEQLLGGDVDGRSDLFAAGVVLYECLSGHLPFDASTPMGLIAQMVDGRLKPLHTTAPEVPAEFAALIHRLLEREPKDRPAGARELAELLGHIGQTGARPA